MSSASSNVQGKSSRAETVFDRFGSPTLSEARPVPMRSLAGPELERSSVPERPVAIAKPVMGQMAQPRPVRRERMGVAIQTLSRREAAQMAEALGPAIEKTDQAAMQGIRCPGVQTDTVRVARALQNELDRFLMTEDAGFPLEANPQKAATAVLDCAIMVDQVNGKKTSGLTNVVIGGVVLLGLVIVGTQLVK